MNEAAIIRQLQELNRELTQIGSPGQAKQLRDVSQLNHEPSEASLADTVSQIRMKLKYVMFDLEATRRENHYLRQMLEIHRNGGRNRHRSDDGQWDGSNGEF
ncbi:MAG: hypothetical protein ACYTFO_10845 [Planctomycetota bacterium]